MPFCVSVKPFFSNFITSDLVAMALMHSNKHFSCKFSAHCRRKHIVIFLFLDLERIIYEVVHHVLGNKLKFESFIGLIKALKVSLFKPCFTIKIMEINF